MTTNQDVTIEALGEAVCARLGLDPKQVDDLGVDFDPVTCTYKIYWHGISHISEEEFTKMVKDIADGKAEVQ